MPERNSDPEIVTGNDDSNGGNPAGSASTGDNGGYQPSPGEIIIDPTSIGSASGSNSGPEPVSGKRKRGRPAGPQKTRSPQNLDPIGIEKILLSAHGMMAAFFSTPELELDQKEAQELSEASIAVARHYDIGATQKTIDWTNLMMVFGAVYGTRFMAIRLRKSTPQKKEGEQ